MERNLYLGVLKAPKTNGNELTKIMSSNAQHSNYVGNWHFAIEMIKWNRKRLQ